jgi:hypothetical protein
MMPDGDYVVSTSKGEELARGKLGLGKHNLEIKVPAAGFYWLKYNDYNAGFRFIPDKSQQGAFVLEQGQPFKATNRISSFFYVPKGTKNIYLFANNGGARFGIRQPDGKWVGGNAEGLKADGFYLTIPVPPGMDGKVWTALKINGDGSNVHFFNVPDVMSFSSDGVLVPEDVAERDGLGILVGRGAR